MSASGEAQTASPAPDVPAQRSTGAVNPAAAVMAPLANRQDPSVVPTPVPRPGTIPRYDGPSMGDRSQKWNPGDVVIQRAAADTPDPAAAAVASGLATLDRDGSVVFAAPAGGSAAAPSPFAVQRAAGDTSPPPPAAPAAGGQASHDQVEELAKQVYDTIRDRLRADLRLDRERAGRITDLAR
jgi:hypothetical protein